MPSHRDLAKRSASGVHSARDLTDQQSEMPSHPHSPFSTPKLVEGGADVEFDLPAIHRKCTREKEIYGLLLMRLQEVNSN